MKRRVLAITAIRSEYFLQRPIFRAINDHPDLELNLVVAGAHHSALHGYTAKEVEADGFTIAANIHNLIISDRDADRLKGTVNQLQELVEIVDKMRPDWLLTPADREESITMALCGAFLQLPTAHYSAGDRGGANVDDMIRQAVSRLSHLLLTTSEDSRQRLIRTGEDEWRVHNVGHSGLDRIRATPKLDAATLARELGVTTVESPYLVVIQHPFPPEMDQAGSQMKTTLDAVAASGLEAFISYPNSDPGSSQIIEVIESFRSNPKMHIFKNIADVPFVNLLRGATALLGNSSLGLLEAPFLGLATINVGGRQAARHHSSNLFYIPPDSPSILNLIRRITSDEKLQETIKHCDNPFGDGYTGPRVANLLAETPIDDRLLNKDMAY